MKKSIRVESNDPDSPSTRLTIAAEVVVEVGFDRSSLYIPSVEVGKPVVKVVKILAKEPNKLKLEEPKVTNSDVFKPELLRGEIDGKKTFDLRLTVQSDDVGRVGDKVTIKTNHPDFPQIALRVRANIVGPIHFSPRRVYLTHASNRTKVVLSSSAMKFKPLSAEDPRGEFKASITEVKPGRQYDIFIEATEEFQKKNQGKTGYIHIRTNNKQQELIKVPVTYRPGKIKGAAGKKFKQRQPSELKNLNFERIREQKMKRLREEKMKKQ